MTASSATQPLALARRRRDPEQHARRSRASASHSPCSFPRCRRAPTTRSPTCCTSAPARPRLLWSREPLTPERDRRARSRPSGENLAALQRALAFGESLGLAPSTSYQRAGRDAQGGDRVGRDRRAARQARRRSPGGSRSSAASRTAATSRPSARRSSPPSSRPRATTCTCGPSPLYSTLGWFDDPLPRNLLRLARGGPDRRRDPRAGARDGVRRERRHLRREPGELHRAPGDARAVRATGPSSPARARDAFADELTYARMLNALAAELEAAVRRSRAGRTRRARGARRSSRATRRRCIPRSPGARSASRASRRSTLSNAWLVGNRDYLGLLPCFERELAALGGDLPAFVRAHREQPGHRAPDCEATP